jgi:hypothetical protein
MACPREVSAAPGRPTTNSRRFCPTGTTGTVCRGESARKVAKKVTVTICLETPAYGRGRVACGDRQMVTVTFFPT